MFLSTISLIKYQSGSIFIADIPTTFICILIRTIQKNIWPMRNTEQYGVNNENKSEKNFDISAHGHGTS